MIATIIGLGVAVIIFDFLFKKIQKYMPLKTKVLEKKNINFRRGSVGTVFFWVTALIGVIFVITVYIVFDNVLWADENSLASALIPMGLDMESTPMVTLKMLWGMWAPVFVIAWALALIIHSIIREPDVGMR